MMSGKRMRIKNLLCKPRGGETAANKPRTRRSLTSTSGSLFVEAAILFPVAVFALMGTIETMNVYLQRGSVINVANSIAMAIQQNPDITAQKMYEFQKSLGGGVTPFKEVNISDGSPYTGTTPCSAKDCRVTGLDIRIGASTTPVQEQNIRNLAPSDWSSPYVSKLPGQANPAWPNAVSPLKADPNQSAADDAKAFYVGVRVAWQNRPIFTRLGFASVTTTQFAGVVVKPTVSIQCPGGQTVTGISADGSAICAWVKQLPVGKYTNHDHCYWSDWFGGKQAGKNGVVGRSCSNGYYMAGLMHQNDAGSIGHNNDDEAFQILCCRAFVP